MCKTYNCFYLLTIHVCFTTHTPDFLWMIPLICLCCLFIKGFIYTWRWDLYPCVDYIVQNENRPLYCMSIDTGYMLFTFRTDFLGYIFQDSFTKQSVDSSSLIILWYLIGNSWRGYFTNHLMMKNLGLFHARILHESIWFRLHLSSWSYICADSCVWSVVEG